MTLSKPLTKKQLTSLRKKDAFINRMFAIQELLPQLINAHKEIFNLIEQSLDTNKKDFDITLNDRRFFTSIPFTKEEANILNKQRKAFIRYVMSIFYKGLVKDKEDPYLIFSFFVGANPKDYTQDKRTVRKRISKEEQRKFIEKKGALNKSALAEVELENEYRKDNPELYSNVGK